MVKLLFIDDDSGILESVKMLFKLKPNYKLFLAQSGQEALQITEKEKIDLVVLDMVLGDMSGEKVFQELKRLNPNIKVIFLSGLEQEEVAEKAQTLGAQGYLTKPFDAFKLEDFFKKTVPELY